MALTNASKQPIIGRASVENLSAQLLRHLFTLIEKDSEPAKLQENEFLMRCIMRVLIVIKEAVVPMVDELLTHFVKITQISSQNPSNPRFCYYLFEALGAFIRYGVHRAPQRIAMLMKFRFGAPSRPEKLENGLYLSFIAVIEDDVQGENR